MGKKCLCAAIDILLQFMALNFSESTIEKLEHIVTLIPETRLDEATIRLREMLKHENLTEEEALDAMDSLLKAEGASLTITSSEQRSMHGSET